jgi:hypothetical protein
MGAGWRKALDQSRARALFVITPQLRKALAHGTQPKRQQSLKVTGHYRRQ